MNKRDLDSIYPNPVNFRQEPDTLPTPKKSNLGILWALIIILLIGGATFLGWRNYGWFKEKYLSVRNWAIGEYRNITNSLPTATPLNTGQWQTYQNDQYGYSIKYPHDWSHFTWVAKGVYSDSIAYKETVGFDESSSGENKKGGDLMLLVYAQNLDATISDVKNQTMITNGPNKLQEEATVLINNISYRRLTYTRFIPEPVGYDPSDHQIFYLASNDKFTYVISLGPYRHSPDTDQAMLESFNIK